LEDAIAQAQEWDTIYVAPGTYETGLLITTPGITVIGNSTEGDVIVGNAGDAIAGLHAPRINISGITFTDDRAHMGIMSMSNADYSIIKDVELIATQGGEGLNIRDSENVTFRNITIRTNDRQAVRVLRSSNIKFNNFSFSCNTSMGGCFELDTTDDILLEEGLIELRGGGTAIYDLAGGNLTLTDITAYYTEKFIMMETGNVSMYNMDIDPADILMDIPNPIHAVRSYFLRNVKMSVEVVNGTIEPLEGGHLIINTDGSLVYSTEHFNGTDVVSDGEGGFADPFPFLSWELAGGENDPTNGTNTVTGWFQGDQASELDLGIVDANVTNDIEIILTGAYNQTRTIHNRLHYEIEPSEGNYTLNATVLLYGKNMTLLETRNISEKVIKYPIPTPPPPMVEIVWGAYFQFVDLPIGVNYTIVAIPENEVLDGGDKSGYLRAISWVNLSYYPIVHTSLNDLEFKHYEAVSAPIFGFVRYKDGPKEGGFVEGAEVRLFNSTEDEMGVATTNETGYYEFPDIPFNEIYEIQVTPPLDELGVNLEITGYLPWDNGFWHNSSNRINASVKYYEHVEPVSPHPEVIILDENGDPLEGAQVEVTIEGATYTAKTNLFGKAVFQSLDMEDFPLDAEFKASKEGYDDIKWEQGDDIPAIKESGSEDQTWLLVILVIVVLLVLAVAAYLIFMRKGPAEEIEE
jgi:hypothetical protein